MSEHEPTPALHTEPSPRHRALAVLWVPGLAVAVGAAVATAHGLFEVARAAGAPALIAALYPLITDGLALVAYAATTRLSGRPRRYAWAVVVLAAGLSGLAQATFLAGGVPANSPEPAPPAPLLEHEVPAGLRFGIGAWPAVAAAVVAHLLFLLATTSRATHRRLDTQRPTDPDRPIDRPTGGDPQRPTSVQGTPPLISLDTVQRPHRDTAQPSNPRRPTASNQRSATDPRTKDAPPATLGMGAASEAVSARDRARSTAREHQAEHGDLPSARQLAEAADVSRGTAAAALKDLREGPERLQIVPSPATKETP